MFSQTIAIFLLNVRSMRARMMPSLLVIAGIAVAVGVFVAMWAAAAGFEATLAGTGSAERALVLRSGSTSEINGSVSLEQHSLISTLPQVKKLAGRPMAAMETFVTVNLQSRDSQSNAAVPMRGISAASYVVRPEVVITAGRAPNLGKFELLVGRIAAQEFEGLDLGADITIRGTQWKITGVFAAENSAYESELWVPERLLAQLWRRGETFSSILLVLNDANDLAPLNARLTEDKRLIAHALRESNYYANQANGTTTLIRGASLIVGVIMALGAVFATLTTLYAALATRTTEMATLRAVGFGKGAIAMANSLEASLLGLAGALIGAGSVATLLASTPLTTAAATSSTFTQVAFKLLITPELLVAALLGAFVLSIVGSIPPIVGALRVSVAEGLRRG